MKLAAALLVCVALVVGAHAQTPVPIGQAKSSGPGWQGSVTGIVTAVFPDNNSFVVESENRSSAITVNPIPTSVPEIGDELTVTGTIQGDGALAMSDVAPTGRTNVSVRPVGSSNKNITNTDMLVSAWGKIIDPPTLLADGSTRFHITDSSAKTVAPSGTITWTPLMTDDFESGRGNWEDITTGANWYTSQWTESGDFGHVFGTDYVMTSGPGGFTRVNGFTGADVKVEVDELGISPADVPYWGGVMVRQQGSDGLNCVMLVMTARSLIWHKRVAGSLSGVLISANWSDNADHIGINVHLTVTVVGNTFTAHADALDDSGATTQITYTFGSGQVWETGGVGLHSNGSLLTRNHGFDNFKLYGTAEQSTVTPDAVRVVIPPSVTGYDYSGQGDYVKVTGIAGKTVVDAGELKCVTLREADDLAPIVRASRGQCLFPTNMPSRTWYTFDADGFSQPVSGLIYNMNDVVTCGMPLGGVDTGCIDLETSGLLGYCTIFNTHVPRRGPINLPVLGMSLGGQTWVMCNKQPKQGWGSAQNPVIPVLSDLSTLSGVKTPSEIHYWGHYPVADMEFETDAPVSVGMRAWTPFMPGDVVTSMLPGAVFEVRLRNTSASAQEGTVAFSFPGPTSNEAGATQFTRQQVAGDFSGVTIFGSKASYALGVTGSGSVRTGGELGASGAAWANIASALPTPGSDQPGSSAAVDFSLSPGETRTVRFVLTWCAPTWKGGGYNWVASGNTFTHMYAKYYSDALSTAQSIAGNHASLLGRVVSWQQTVYTDNSLPAWLRDSLVNILHLITETGLWAQANSPIPSWVRTEDGLWGMNECPRDCPQIECIPCSFYGNIPVVYFFPELAVSTLRGYMGYQDAEGSPPWIFGGQTGGTPPIDFACPTRGYQVVLNGDCYVDMLDRYLLCAQDASILPEFYQSIKKSVIFTMSLNTGPDDAVISMPDHRVSVGGMPWESEWFEWYEWYGMATHVGGIHLANLSMAKRMAESMGDTAFATQCQQWITSGQSSLENKMWNGFYYLNWWDQAAGNKSDVVFGYQLDGQWMAKFHGLSGVFPENRVQTTLDTIKRYNVQATRFGAINYTHSDGTMLAAGESPMRGGYAPYDFFSPELLMLASTYMYEGQKDLGVELARRYLTNVADKGIIWDQGNIIRGDTGERTFGADYYQNLMLWSLPAAVEGQGMGGPVLSGGLVARIVEAACTSVAMPVISPSEGSYSSAQSVSLTCRTSGASIYYTTDGSDPTDATGTPYIGPVTVARSLTLKARAYKAGKDPSLIAHAAFVITAAQPVFTPPPGIYTAVQSVAISCPTSGSMIYYTTNGADPTSASGTQYTTPITVSQTMTIKARAYAPSLEPSAVASGAYLIGASATWNLVSDFSDLTNPIAAWTYGVATSSFVWARPFDTHTSNWIPGEFGANANPGWYDSSFGTHWPGVAKGQFTCVDDLPVGRFGGHTPYAVRWTSPYRANINISGDLWMWRDWNRTQNFSLTLHSQSLGTDTVLINQAPIPARSAGVTSSNTYSLAQAIVAGGGSASQLQNVAVDPGDTLTIAITYLPAIGVGDFVGLDLNIVGVAR